MHKGDNNNYRPTLFCQPYQNCSKNLFKLNLQTFLNEYNVLHQTQSGFFSKHSTETALIFMTKNWLKAINDGKLVITIMVEFRKAFDLVDHGLLLEKLSYYKRSETFITLT